MKTIKNKIQILSFLIISFLNLNAQMNYWATPPSKLDVRNSVISASPLYNGAPSSDAYRVANGIYNGCGNLLFYIKNTTVYDNNGNAVGQLGGRYVNPNNCAENYFRIKGEIAIVPKPGDNNSFYAIYVMCNGVGSGEIFYAIITVSNGAITVTNSSFAGWYPCGSGGQNIPVYNAFRVGGLGANPGGIAVSQLQPNNTRYLFACGDQGIYRYDITGTGIANEQIIASYSLLGLTTNDFGSMELELSPDGKWLAFSNYNPIVGNFITNKVYTIKLDQNFNYVGKYPYTLNAVKGLEFDNTSSYLYAAGGTSSNNVLCRIDVNNQTVTNISTGGYDWSNTFLELAKNNRIIGIVPAGASRRLIQINTSNNALSASIYTSFNSQHTDPMMNNVYTLPDQIDGENYSQIYPPSVQINNITLNNSNFTGNCDEGGLLTLYNCNSVYLNVSYVNNTTTPADYQIELYQVSACSILYGSNYLNYNSNWINGTIPANLDLRSLTDANGNSLYNKTGRFLVKVSVRDACGNISYKQGYFECYSTIPPVLNLEIYNTYWTDPSNPYLPASQNINSPILTGALSAAFRINNSVGNVTGYNVTIGQVDNTGNVIKNIYNKTYATNNISTVGTQNLNSYCIASSVWSPYTGINSCTSTNPNYSGYTGYWGYNNGQLSVGNYYKITVTLYNPCSNATNYSYIYVNNGGMRVANKPEETDNLSKTSENTYRITNFPNPAQNQINISIQSDINDVISIHIFDLSGRLIETIVDNYPIQKGENYFQKDINRLANGFYLLKSKNGNGLSQNKLIEIKH